MKPPCLHTTTLLLLGLLPLLLPFLPLTLPLPALILPNHIIGHRTNNDAVRSHYRRPTRNRISHHIRRSSRNPVRNLVRNPVRNPVRRSVPSSNYLYLNLPMNNQRQESEERNGLAKKNNVNPGSITDSSQPGIEIETKETSEEKRDSIPRKDGKGYHIYVNADDEQQSNPGHSDVGTLEHPKISKRDEVDESLKNASSTSQQDDEIQKDIYDQLKTRFEKIEHHLQSFSKQSNKEEPQVRVIVITPKVLNGSADEKSLNLLDLENAASFGKDNLFVKELSSKEYDDTFGSVLRKKEEQEAAAGGNGGKSSDNNNNSNDEHGTENKEVKDLESMSPLLSDKDTLNEVIREINLLRNYSRDDNLTGVDDGERSQAASILDDVMVMAKGETNTSPETKLATNSAVGEHAQDSHEIGYPSKEEKADESALGKSGHHGDIDEGVAKKVSVELDRINHLDNNDNNSNKNSDKMSNGDSNNSTQVEEENKSQTTEATHKEKSLLMPTAASTLDDKISKVKSLQRHRPTSAVDVSHSKHFDEDKKAIKVNKKDGTKTSSELIAKEFEKGALKRNNSQQHDEAAAPASRTSGDQKDRILSDSSTKVIDKQKAEAIIEFLNKDPLEVWRYAFKNLHALDLNSTLLRSGLVNAGNIERLKGVMRRALEGKSITISIVGGSISAGGGLYKDEKSIAGLYYKGLIDWWQKMITPLTGADMLVNNVAIGSIGTDYFSYCVKNHIANESDIVLWELSANDYNRYKMQPTKGARPLERFTRMVLELPNKPALLYINFFKGVDYKATRESCPDFEDQGEDIIAHYYKIPSLSWRAMVCSGLVNHRPGHGIETLFSADEYHPSIRGHAQMSLLILLHLRHVMRAVLQWAIAHDGFIDKFEEHYVIPEPLFMGPRYPEPLCWSLISPDLNQKLTNSLFVRVKSNDGFKLEYATNFPIRFDKVVCWKAEKPHAEIALQFFIPDDYGPTGVKRDRSEVAITTHTRWGGSSTIWIDEKVERNIIIKEGREHDPGKRTQVDSLINDVGPGYHILHVRAHEAGFCLSAIMIDSS